MKKINEILFINEDASLGKWTLSFYKPEFQGGDSYEISKELAIRIMYVMLKENEGYNINEMPDSYGLPAFTGLRAS